MLAFVFPGQGSQVQGMGGELFDFIPEFAKNEEEIDHLLGFSPREICLYDHGKLGKTEYTQPCLYLVNSLHYLKAVSSGRLPDMVAGHSLGEYNALFAAGAFDLLTGLKLVKKRGELMAKVAGGGMAAVVGMDMDDIANEILREGFEDIDIANVNSPRQVVISGPSERIAQFIPVLEASGAQACVPLAVSAAFHSRYMVEAAQEFKEYLAQFRFENIKIPVASNVTGRSYVNEDIAASLAKQITQPVLWTQCVRFLVGEGATELREIGPGKVLTNLIDQIRSVEPLERVAALTKAEIETQPKTEEAARSSFLVSAETLGSESFRRDYGVRYAYVSGSMYKGIASKELVEAMARRGLMSYFGTGGLNAEEVEQAILYLKSALQEGQSYGMNLLADHNDSSNEERNVELYLKHGVRFVEASAFIQVTSALVHYRVAGLRRTDEGDVAGDNRIMAKVSRPEVAEQFMRPPPAGLVQGLLAAGKITPEQAELATSIPLAQEICVEADSGGHTDRGNISVLLPAIMVLRSRIAAEEGYPVDIRVGAAGGIGTPESAVAAFMLGADFILTGSVNQCTIEAGTSDAVKDILQDINVQDTTYAPAGDMFEMGAIVQVVKKSVLFPARANKLHELYRRYSSLDEIDPRTQQQIQEKYFKKTFSDVWKETSEYYKRTAPGFEERKLSSKQKMALVFRWYFVHTSRLALTGDPRERVDYQIHCGPALGAFNQWVKGGDLESWRNRSVVDVAEHIMQETSALIRKKISALTDSSAWSECSEADLQTA